MPYSFNAREPDLLRSMSLQEAIPSLTWRILDTDEDTRSVLTVQASGAVDDAMLKLIRIELSQNTPMRAWDSVEILENQTSTPNALLKMQLWLTPIKDQDPQSEVAKTISLHRSSAGKSALVYCTDLGVKGELGSGLVPPIPLAILRGTESLSLRASWRLGVGSEHTRFVPIVGDIERKPSSSGCLHIEFVTGSRAMHIKWWEAALQSVLLRALLDANSISSP